jgi:Protein of unknown function (DUF1097)
MSHLTALSLSIAVLGAIWAFLALGPLSPYVLVWAGFLAWGCFFHSGGDTPALTKTIIGTVYGAIVGYIALLVIAHVKVDALGVVWPAIVVGFFVFFLVIVASVPQLSVVPANVYGFAAVVAYTVHAEKAMDSLTMGSFSNPVLKIIVSLVIGALFGYASGQLAHALESRRAVA